MSNTQINLLLSLTAILVAFWSLLISYLVQKTNHPFLTDVFIEQDLKTKETKLSCIISTSQPIIIKKTSLLKRNPVKSSQKQYLEIVPDKHSCSIGDNSIEFKTKEKLDSSFDYYLTVVTNYKTLSSKGNPIRRIFSFSSTSKAKLKVVGSIDIIDGTFKSFEKSK